MRGRIQAFQRGLDVGEVAGEVIKDDVVKRFRHRIGLDVSGAELERGIASMFFDRPRDHP